MADSLDPEDWQGLRAQGHRLLDDLFDHLQGLRDKPVWQPIPPEIRARRHTPLPAAPASLDSVREAFLGEVLPYAGGNLHPGFMGWVQGAGTPVGMLGEMLAAGLNANCGGRDHMPIAVEQEVAGWVRQMFAFPDEAVGLFVTGASMANFIGVLAARQRALGPAVRAKGLAGSGGERLVAYASRDAHNCVPRAMEMAGLGREALRLIPVDANHQVDLGALRAQLEADRTAGLTPFLIVGNAGTVDAGAIDDLDGLADIAAAEGCWLHIDGAYGALGMLTPAVAPKLAGIERADSIAFDFHKWGQAPYDAGFIIARDGARLREAFAVDVHYLSREGRGLAGGDFWPCDYGPDLSRGFRALKVWFAFKALGADAIGESIARSCTLGHELGELVAAEPALELLAPVQLNIVCFRYRCADADPVNAAIVADLQEAGRVAPSMTRIDGQVAIRAALFNHRTDRSDLEALVRQVVSFGDAAVRKGEAALIQPELKPSIGLAALARMIFEGADLQPLWGRLVERASADPGDAAALMDAATLLLLSGDRENGLGLQAQAIERSRLYLRPAPGTLGLRLLALTVAGDTMANTPLDFLLEGSDIELLTLYVGADGAIPASLPDYDLAFISVGESAANQPVLRALERAAERLPGPLINGCPDRIAALTRDGVCALLEDAPEIVAPSTARMSRAQLAEIGRSKDVLPAVLPGATFPIIVRPLDSHAGRGLEKLDGLEAIDAYLSGQTGEDFYVAPFVDYANPDGLFRKARIALIEGRPFVCHMAVSPRWMVHYLNADMLENAANRDEEARFMAGFDEGFGRRHAAAFARLHERIGLDYFAIDCAETRDGRLLLFEADVAMIVHAMDPQELFAYKQPQMRKVFDAFQSMLRQRAAI